MTIDVAIDNNTVKVENIILAPQWFLGRRRGLYMIRISARSSRSNDDVMVDENKQTRLHPRHIPRAEIRLARVIHQPRSSRFTSGISASDQRSTNTEVKPHVPPDYSIEMTQLDRCTYLSIMIEHDFDLADRRDASGRP